MIIYEFIKSFILKLLGRQIPMNSIELMDHSDVLLADTNMIISFTSNKLPKWTSWVNDHWRQGT